MTATKVDWNTGYSALRSAIGDASSGLAIAARDFANVLLAEGQTYDTAWAGAADAADAWQTKAADLWDTIDRAYRAQYTTNGAADPGVLAFDPYTRSIDARAQQESGGRLLSMRAPAVTALARLRAIWAPDAAHVREDDPLAAYLALRADELAIVSRVADAAQWSAALAF